MRKVATLLSIVVLCELGTVSAKGSPRPADQPRTMDEVIDRVITNENRANQQIKQYSPLVETYIQNLKPDKELGYTPAGDKYFLGRADFSKGVALVSLTDNNSKGKKIFGSVGNFFSFAMQFLPDGFLQMIFIDTNGSRPAGTASRRKRSCRRSRKSSFPCCCCPSRKPARRPWRSRRAPGNICRRRACSRVPCPASGSECTFPQAANTA